MLSNPLVCIDLGSVLLGQDDDGPVPRSRRSPRTCSHRAAGPGDLSPGRGSRRLRSPEPWPRNWPSHSPSDPRRHSDDPVGDDPARTSSPRPMAVANAPAARRDIPARGGRRPRSIDRRIDHRLEACPECHGPLTRTNQTRTRDHRGHPRGDHAGRHRAHDPSRLVPPLPEGRRAGRHRRPARRHARQSHPGPLGLAPLRAGQHPLPDRRRLQPSPDVQAHPRRPGPDVVSAPGDPLRLVSGDPDPGVGLGGPARRRDRLAGQRQDPLAVVLHHDRSDLLHDRSESGQPGVGGVLQGRVRTGRWSPTSGGPTTRSSARDVRSAWCICCAN